MKVTTLLLAGLMWASAAHAEVKRIVIDRKVSPAFDGRSFGTAGPYETIAGRAFGELDPNDPHNRVITDIALAKRNANGKIEYVASFFLVKQRLATGDPRLSLEERYKTHEGYVEAVKAASAHAVAQQFLLQEDADKLIAQAAASNILRTENRTR